MGKGEELTLLWGSESVLATTGYGTVTKNLLSRLLKKGWKVFLVGWQHYGVKLSLDLNGDGNPLVMMQSGTIPMGNPGHPQMWGKYIKTIKPDITGALGDLFIMENMRKESNNAGLPFFCYFPQDNPNLSLNFVNDLKYTTHPVTISEFGRKVTMDTVKKYGEGGWKHHWKCDVLLHGVDTKIFDKFNKDEIYEKKKLLFEGTPEKKRRFPAGADTFCYFFMGKNNRRKKIDRLLYSFNKVAKKYKDVILFLKVGDPLNQHGLGCDIIDIIEKLDLRQRIVILDAESNYLEGVPDLEMAGYYNLSDAIVSASSAEGFGLSTIEGFACGKPTIITDAFNSRELIGEKEERGWLVPVKTYTIEDYNAAWALIDIDKMAEAMEDAYLHRKNLQRKGNNAYNWVRKNLSWDKIADDFNEYLRKAVNEHKGISQKEFKEILNE